MKKLMILSMAFVLSIPLVFGQIEKNEKELIKGTKEEIKKEKSNLQILDKDLKGEKKELKYLEGNDVSDRAKQNFKVDFGDVPNVIWKRDGTYDIAEFTKDGKEMKAYYDYDSDLIGTTHLVTFADLPQKGKEEIEREYQGYEIGPVFFFENNKFDAGMVRLYGMEFESRDNYFVELTKGPKKIVLQVFDSGDVRFFNDIE